MGDRWLQDDLMASTYIWLPLSISGTDVIMKNQASWVPSVSTQDWSPSPSSTQYQGEDFELSNGAIVVSCSGCSNGEAAGYIGGSSSGTASFGGITAQESGKTTIRIQYENGDSEQRHATVNVNGIAQTLAFLPTADGSTPGSSSLNCVLSSEQSNTISFTTTDGTYGPDIDIIYAPVS